MTFPKPNAIEQMILAATPMSGGAEVLT